MAVIPLKRVWDRQPCGRPSLIPSLGQDVLGNPFLASSHDFIASSSLYGRFSETSDIGTVAHYNSAEYHYAPVSIPPSALKELSMVLVFRPENVTETLTSLYSFGSSSTNTPMVRIQQGSSAGKLRWFVRADNGVTDSYDLTPDGGYVNGQWYVAVLRLSVSIGLLDMWVGRLGERGKSYGQVAPSSLSDISVDRQSVGTLMRASSSSPWSGDVALALAFGRRLFDAECESICINPWSVYRRSDVTIGISDVGVPVSLYGGAASRASAFGALQTDILLSGASVGFSSSSGNITTSIDLSGASAAVSLAAGDLQTQVTLSGAAIASAMAAAALVDTALLIDGDGSAVASASGDLTVSIRLSGDALVSSSAVANLSTVPGGLAGDASAVATGSGALETQIPLVGSGTATATGSGGLGIPLQLVGAAASVSTATGELTLSLDLSAAAMAIAGASASLTTSVALAGAAVSSAVAAGSFAGSTPRTMPPARLVDVVDINRRVSATDLNWRLAR